MLVDGSLILCPMLLMLRPCLGYHIMAANTLFMETISLQIVVERIVTAMSKLLVDSR